MKGNFLLLLSSVEVIKKKKKRYGRKFKVRLLVEKMGKNTIPIPML